MSNEESSIRGAAAAVRPHLPELIGTESAGTFTAELAAAPDDESLISVISRQDRVREWMSDYLEAVSASERDYTRLSGDPGFVRPSATFTCPEGTLVWYRRFVGERPPKCPVHDVDLVRTEEQP
ncbi:hypothetical protein DMA12_14900 [Amycolatopsis balhimycina DSM 5908]|uniref:Uncharacterized protein n=1 Tax=Amycolatopsis balhimycina DSM 5908 TaxID=1081091 RepID=A0A428WP34_AMYBA|nr:hypothetical protein [Amycolatopsis balhimycina]RSM44832.1 hypothetical protein DMA12_14900 [Amycolatopsis balhimycina DSM 5908]